MSDATQNKAGFADDGPVIPDHIPLWPETAADKMKIDVTVSKDSQVWVLHNQPFPNYLEWIEFDAETGLMSFVTAQGKIQELGMTIHSPMSEYVALAKDVRTILVQDKEIKDMGIVPLTVRKFYNSGEDE